MLHSARMKITCWTDFPRCFALTLALASLAALPFPVRAQEVPRLSRTSVGARTALDRYVAAPDATYKFELVKTIQSGGTTTQVLRLTSQTWLTKAEVNLPVWEHWLSIIRPAEVTSGTAFLMISGGSNDKPAPEKVDGSALIIANSTKSVVAVLSNVPSQPVIFAGETRTREEDELIAYTWDKFLRTGEEKWLARLPMTKAAVRAMDAVTAFSATDDGGKLKMDKFFVMGGSKRGWTTWTTAAVDDRVVGIAPAVIDVLNLEPSMLAHFGAYGFFAPAVGNYTETGIMDWMGSPEMHKLLHIEDPFEYRERLTLPKFIFNAAGDQFFTTDSARFYFNELPGVKYLRTVPNADHGMKGTDAVSTIAACYDAVLKKTPLPQFSWKDEGEDGLRVSAQTKPSAVKLWQATNPEARDFRLETLGKVWTSADLVAAADGTWLGKVSKPEKGWTAYFVELTFPGGAISPFIFTTVPKVFPDVRPHKWKKPE